LLQLALELMVEFCGELAGIVAGDGEEGVRDPMAQLNASRHAQLLEFDAENPECLAELAFILRANVEVSAALGPVSTSSSIKSC
jgi:hypothetical protein